MTAIITTIIWLLLFFTPFYYNYSMRKTGAYELFNTIQKFGFVLGFMFVTCKGASLLFERFQWNDHGALLAICGLSCVVHIFVLIGKLAEEYQEDAHYPH